MRLLRIIIKEFKQIMHDRGFILSLIFIPLILMIIFNATFKSDVKNLDTIIIDNDNSVYSESIKNAARDSEYFNVIENDVSFDQAKEKLKISEVRSIIVVPEGFSEKLDNAEKADMKIYIDSSDYTVYNVIKSASGQLLKDSLKDIINLIVAGLETEKNINQNKIDEINELTDNLKVKADRTKANLDDLSYDFDDFRTQINDMESSITDLDKSLNALPKDSDVVKQFSEIKNEFDSLKDKVNNHQKSVDSIEYDIDGIKVDYDSIKEKVQNIDVKLENLKKDFLSQPIEFEKQFEYGEISYFQYLTPGIISLILFFIGISLTLLNLIEEKQSKTLYRMMTTPVNKWEIFFGKFFLFFVIGIFEAGYILLISILFFNVNIAGSILYVFYILVVLMSASIGLGLMLSEFVKTTKQAFMLGPLIIIPSILISQTFSPVEVMPQYMRYVAYLIPMYYSNNALRDVMIKGASFSTIAPEIILLTLYAFITVSLGALIFRKKIQ